MVKTATAKNSKTVKPITRKKKEVTVTEKTIQPKKTKEKVTLEMLFEIWLDGWKKTFVSKGRSSRFELWAFLLINSMMTSIVHFICSYINSAAYLRYAYAKGFDIEAIESHIVIADAIFYTVMIVSFLPLISLLVRRMHDVGYLAWKKYLEPASMSMVSMWIMFLASLYIEDMGYNGYWFEFLAVVGLALYLCFIVSVYATGYYGLKFLITTLFYIGDEEANAYGKAVVYDTPYYENVALNFSCIYLLFIGTMSLLYLVLFLI